MMLSTAAKLPEKAASRAAEAVFSPPSSAVKSSGGDTTFRSPKPAKVSNIRVVTRIRPLLTDELVSGRQLCITPIPSAHQPTISERAIGNDESRISPKTSQPNLRSSAKVSHLPSPTIKSPSFLPSKSKSLRNRTPNKPALPTSTSLHAGHGSNLKKFDFDAVLPMNATQENVYETVVGDHILTDVFRGINFTIMAYGQTCSGKSHTMQGYKQSLDSRPGMDSEDAENICPNYDHPELHIAETDGIIPRAIHDIFQGKKKFRSKGTVTLEMTFMEVYQEHVRDLLRSGATDFQNLKILDQGAAGVVLEGLERVKIESAEQAYALVNFAAERRATSSTYLNIQSSRSHAICTLSVTITPFDSSQGDEITQAKLTLVDLAGSERLKRSGALGGVQQQESITINKDLFVLGKVVSALADKSRSSAKERHVAYRDSKLTRLLRESLGGKDNFPGGTFLGNTLVALTIVSCF